MTLLAVPNVSEGRDERVIAALQEAVVEAGAVVLDVHTDHVHNRTVLTVTAEADMLSRAMTALAVAARELIDLTRHEGVHPRVGALDVCPFVPHGSDIEEAVLVARTTARDIGDRGLPVFLYGAAAQDRSLPELRRGGLEGVSERVAEGDVPDFGPHEIEPSSGIVCVGARGPLIAFNVNIDANTDVARSIAKRLRDRHGSTGLRALGLWMPQGSQVSMNITEPEAFGVENAFEAVEAAANENGVTMMATEIVGLVEERFLPAPDAKTTRLLIEPGRSVESAL